MRIKLTSIMVDDQEKAVRFYTDVLGFVKRKDFPVGEYRWITVTSPEAPTDLELALEPNANPAGKAFRTRCSSRAFPWRRSKSATSPPSSRDRVGKEWSSPKRLHLLGPSRSPSSP